MALNSPRQPPTPEVCPVCGADVPKRALACPDCGADHRSGWREDEDTEFDYNEFVASEFGTPRQSTGTRLIWQVTAVLLLLAFAWYTLRTSF